MKPTRIQAEIIDCIISILETLRNTDDIESPLHINEIEESLDTNLSGYINAKQLGCLENELNKLLYRVRKNK